MLLSLCKASTSFSFVKNPNRMMLDSYKIITHTSIPTLVICLSVLFNHWISINVNAKLSLNQHESVQSTTLQKKYDTDFHFCCWCVMCVHKVGRCWNNIHQRASWCWMMFLKQTIRQCNKLAILLPLSVSDIWSVVRIPQISFTCKLIHWQLN